MAHKRMFSKTVTDSGRFLDMPLSTQALYFHFAMHADDDGFTEYKPIMRLIGAAQDDLKVLVAKDFVKIMDEYVMFINDWRENNYIRSDRYKPSVYLEKYGMTLGIPMVCVDKNRIDKISIDKNSLDKGSGYQEFKKLKDSFRR